MEDYWTKLPLALQENDGPAIFNFHNGQHDNIIGYLAPYDVPKTWDEFREIAKKLTIRNENGDLVQAGFSYNGGIQETNHR